MKPSHAPGQSTAMRRASTRQWVLKPQDLAVVLKLVTLEDARPSYAALAKQLLLSPFEVHAAGNLYVVLKQFSAVLVVAATGAWGTRPEIAGVEF